VSSAPLTSTVDGQSNAAKVLCQPSWFVAVTNFPRSNPKVGLDQIFLKSSEAKRQLNQNVLPGTGTQRLRILSESIEGIFLLGKGSIIFDNAPVSAVDDQFRALYPISKYQVIPNSSGNLLWLFLLLTQAASNVDAQWANLAPYLQRHPVAPGQFLP
jgi:hypothetical protein